MKSITKNKIFLIISSLILTFSILFNPSFRYYLVKHGENQLYNDKFKVRKAGFWNVSYIYIDETRSREIFGDYESLVD